MAGQAMANFQNLVMAPTQSGPSNQCLTGYMYQIVQSPGPQGKNVLQLVPILNAKDNPTQLVSAPVTTNPPMLNVQQPVRFTMPTSVSNVPCPVNAKLVQQLGSANYIITPQKNPAEVSKSIRVDNPLVAHPNTAVLLDKPPLNLPSNPQTGTPSFFIMNTKPSSVPMKTIPLFPSSHGLQIPAHAEMKSVPASSLPFSIQQRILPATTSSDTTKIPNIIYVSPVNAVKTTSAKPNEPTMTTTTSSPVLTPVLVPAVQSSPTKPSKGPFKWVVQENTESVTPVKSSSETQSKLLTLMTGAKAEEANSPSSAGSNITQIKENTLVMCNNKFYFLMKQGSELKSPIHIKQEAPEKIPLQMAQGNDIANKVVEVVLSKNNLSSPNSKQTVNSPTTSPHKASPTEPKPCTPPPASKNIPEVIYIDDDDDDVDVVATSIQKPQDIPRHQPNDTTSAKVFTPSASLGCVSHRSDNQVKAREAERTETAKSPVTCITDDRTLRAKFGLYKKEKIVLGRIPPESNSDSRDADEDVMVYTESQEKRNLDFSDTSNVSKRRKSENDSGFSITAVTTDLSGHFWKSPPFPAERSDVRHATSAETTCTSLIDTNGAYANPSTLHSAQSSVPEMYTDPSDSPSFYASQDITGYFSEASLPRQRFHIESSAYPDETTKDEKIQRLKEVLKEREQALEALRRQKWS